MCFSFFPRQKRKREMFISTIYLKPPQPKNGGISIALLIWGLVSLTFMTAAVILASKCNVNQSMAIRIGTIILAVLFPEIYIIQFLLRKYVFKESQYCATLASPAPL